MKKSAIFCLTVLLLLASALSLAGCALFGDMFAPSDDEDADNKLDSFVECLQNEDGDGIKALFAQNKIANLSDFDESMEELFLYYDGEFVSVSRHATGVENDKDSGIERKWYNMSYDVTTSAAIYRMAFI